MMAHNEPRTFGTYLRSIRKQRELSLREVAKAVQITPTYLSDLERGNNHPPDKALLEKLIRALNVGQEEETRQTLLDLAAEGRNDLPADIKEYLMGNPTLQKLIRKVQSMPDGEQIFARQLSELS